MLPEVHAEVGRILADEIDLPHPSGNQGAHFRHHGGDGPAAVASAHPWDDTKRAGVVAPLGNLNVGGVGGGEAETRGIEVRDEDGVAGHKVERLPLVVVNRRRLDEKPLDDFAKPGHLVEPDKGIDLGEFGSEIGGKALGHAAADDQLLARFFPKPALLVGMKNGIDGFLFGRIDEGAGIDDENIRLAGIGGDRASRGSRRCRA